MRSILLSACLAILPATALAASPLYVNPSGSGPYANIQAAVNAAGAGDLILLADGVYVGTGNHDVTFLGKDISIEGQSGNAASVIIDCGGPGNVGFYFVTNETGAARLADLTVINGWPAIHIDDASPTIQDCIISGNGTLGDWGGSVQLLHSGATVMRCVIENSTGNGISVETSNGTSISDCIIRNNGDDGLFGRFSNMTVSGCIMAGNESNGVHSRNIEGLEVDITNCVITGNGNGMELWGSTGGHTDVRNCTVSGNADGGILIWSELTLSISRCIVWDNCAFDVAIVGGDGFTSIGCSNVDLSEIPEDEYEGSGNFAIDPAFCDPEVCSLAPTDEGDYHLCAASPCLPGAGYGCDVLVGALGEGCACSPVAIESSSWGGIKQRFR